MSFSQSNPTLWATPSLLNNRSIWSSGSFLLVSMALMLEIHQPHFGFKLGNISFILVCLFVLRRQLLDDRRSFSIQGADDIILISYFAWALFTACFSPVPIETVVQVGYAFILWLTIVSIGDQPVHTTLRIIFYLASVAAVVSIALLFLAPEIALQPYSTTGRQELRGIFGHQLWLGMYMGIGCGLLIVALANGHLPMLRGPRHAMIFWAGAAAVAISLLLSQARSPTAALVLALVACYAIAAPSKLLRYSTILLAATGSYFGYLYSDVLLRVIFVTESDITLSGRVEIWRETISAASQQAWTGYGFGSFGSDPFDYLWVHYRPPSAHNSWLQAYFETGYIGTALLAAFVIFLIVRSIYVSVKHRIISYTLFLTLYGVFCSGMSVIYGGKLSVFVTLIWLVSRQEYSAARHATDSNNPAMHR